jgi:hypothetical protein
MLVRLALLLEDGEDEEERLSGLSLEEQVQELVRQAQVMLLDETSSSCG